MEFIKHMLQNARSVFFSEVAEAHKEATQMQSAGEPYNRRKDISSPATQNEIEKTHKGHAAKIQGRVFLGSL